MPSGLPIRRKPFSAVGVSRFGGRIMQLSRMRRALIGGLTETNARLVRPSPAHCMHSQTMAAARHTTSVSRSCFRIRRKELTASKQHYGPCPFADFHCTTITMAERFADKQSSSCSIALRRRAFHTAVFIYTAKCREFCRQHLEKAHWSFLRFEY